jgi:hypothetical protein
VSQLVEALYPLPDVRRTPLSQLRWWESRRLFYNKVVGAAGLVTLVGVPIIFLLPPHSTVMGLPQLAIASAVYGVLANGCYSLGWLVEVLACRVWGRKAPDLGPFLFRQGLFFSVGLTLLPLLLATFIWIARIVATVFGG